MEWPGVFVFKDSPEANNLSFMTAAINLDFDALAGEIGQVEKLRDVLFHAGFVPCDTPGCNCGSWHHRFGLRQRMDEICDELRDAEVLDNSTGNLPLNAVRKLRQRAEAAEAERDALRKLLGEAREMADNWPGIAYSADLTARIDAAMGRE